MRRLAASALVMAAAVVAAVTASGAGGGEDGGLHYRVALDNAFGVIEGADVKVAGVKAGKIERLDVRPSDLRALVTVSLSEVGAQPFRSDVFCEVRPQSLIGEYFLDCQPGRFGRLLPSGSTVPHTQTATTIPADLVGNVLRRPYRERLTLILNELGVGLAARGDDLNETIRRAVPALRDTDNVLQVLERNKFVIQQLTRDADRVLVRLAANRRNVARFVEEARDTAAVSASRRVALAATFRKLPLFLRELRPTLRDLGRAATDQIPALRNLRASAPTLTLFLRRLGPFANASRPAIRTLGAASTVGRRAAADAPPFVSKLREFGEPTPELARNLAIVLEYLDDRDHAVEPDPDSPGGEGYTGLEALLQYPFDQTLTLNVFDQRGYLLKLNVILDLQHNCAAYTDAEHAKEDPERTKDCGQPLGPNQPGINEPDPSGHSDNQQKAMAIDPTARLAAERAMGAASPQAPVAGGAASARRSQQSDQLLDFLMSS
jgi:ABC-type transporter Mla subunit MlaD